MRVDHLAVVGGLGRMGRLVRTIFRPYARRIHVLDRISGPCSWEVLRWCDVVVLAVPTHCINEVVRFVGPMVRREALVMDICSVKAMPVSEMLRHSRCDVIGAHPLFGPTTSSLRGQTMFICPARGDAWVDWVREVLEGEGLQVVEMTPDEHDRLMAAVQALRHLVLIVFGRALMTHGFDLVEHLPISGRWFKTMMELLRRQLSQPPGLYCDILLYNPHALEIAKALAGETLSLSSAIEQGDRMALTRCIDELTAHLDCLFKRQDRRPLGLASEDPR